jgi:glycosyltransferase involved in cell wall biosynthesis
MFVYNNLLHDTRVLKVARTLVTSGYNVTIVAILDDKTKPFEEQYGIKVIRVVKNPIHHYIVHLMIACVRYIKKGLVPFPGKNTRTSERRGKAQGTMICWERMILRMKESGWFFGWGAKICWKLIIRRMRRFGLLFNRPMCFIDYYMRSYKIAMGKPYDIYHANDLNTLPVAWWAARRSGAKLVYDSHELYVERNRKNTASRVGKFLLSQLESFLIRRTDAVITVNESIADELSRRYRIRTPTVVMNTPSRTFHPVNRNVTSLRESLGIKSDYRLLLYAGLITFNRGLENLIQSLVYLPDCHLVFMGYGNDEYKKHLLELTRRIGVESRVSFFGPVPPDEVTIYAASADLGVAPIENACLSYYYCSPNKVFEYIQAGLAVVASDFPELRRVIHQHDIGYTFNPDDPRDISRAVNYIFENPEHWQRMKQNTLTASQYYNWENESKKLLNLYGTLN